MIVIKSSDKKIKKNLLCLGMMYYSYKFRFMSIIITPVEIGIFQIILHKHLLSSGAAADACAYSFSELRSSS